MESGCEEEDIKQPLWTLCWNGFRVEGWWVKSSLSWSIQITQVNKGRPDCSYTWTELCQIQLLGGLLTKFLFIFLTCSSVLALFLWTGIIAIIGWPADDVLILLSYRMCNWGWYCIVKTALYLNVHIFHGSKICKNDTRMWNNS